MLKLVLYAWRTFIPGHTVLVIKQSNEKATKARTRCHVGHDILNMCAMTVTLQPVTDVHRRLASCHTNFRIYPVNEVATWHEDCRQIDILNVAKNVKKRFTSLIGITYSHHLFTPRMCQVSTQLEIVVSCQTLANIRYYFCGSLPEELRAKTSCKRPQSQVGAL